MKLPRVFIPQLIEKWDHTNERFVPAFDFTSAASYGTLTPILEREDNPLFLARITTKIKAALADFGEDDFFVAVGDPSVIAICAGLILRRSRNLKLLKWDKKLARYIVLDLNL
jgi:hypothetical protein